jgi:hypothetical protein
MRRLALGLILVSGLAMTVRAADSISYVVLNNGGTNGLVRVFPDGSVSTIAANVYGYAVAEEPNGNLAVVNAGNPGLQIVTPQGAVSNLVANAPNGSAWIALAVDASGNFIIGDNSQHAIWRVSPSGSSVTMVAHYPVSSPNELEGLGIAFDSAGNYIIASTNQTTPQLIKMTPAGVVSTIPVTGIPGFYGAITSDGNGNFWAATDGAIYRVLLSGIATLVVSDPVLCCNLTGLARDLTTGNILVTVNGGRLALVSNNGSAVTSLGSGTPNFGYPTAVVVDTLVALNPGDQIVTTFAAQANTSNMLLYFNNDPLNVTGSPIFNVTLFNGGALLGTYTHAPIENTFVSAFVSAGVAPIIGGQTVVDFTSINDGAIKGRLITTVSGGSISGFNLADVVLYDAIALTGGGGETPQSDITITSVALNPHPPFFAGEVNFGGNVYYLKFPNGNLFGYYNYKFFPVIYHYDLGFESFVDASDGNAGAYLYDFTSTHWFYTNSGLFPYLYDFTLSNWLYYFPDTKNAGHYTTNPRYFTNLGTGKIFTM